MDPLNGVGFGASESHPDNQYTLASDTTTSLQRLQLLLHQSNVTYKRISHWSIFATQAYFVSSTLILALSLQKILPIGVAFSMSFICSKPEIIERRCQELGQYQLEALDCQGFYFFYCNFKGEIYYLVFLSQEIFFLLFLNNLFFFLS